MPAVWFWLQWQSNSKRFNVPTDEVLTVAHLAAVVVAVLVPEVELVYVTELIADVVAMEVTVAVAEMFAVEEAVEHNEGRPPDKIAEVVDPSTIVAAALVQEVDLVDVSDYLPK